MLIQSCTSQKTYPQLEQKKLKSESLILPGCHNFDQYLSLLRGKRVGCVVNQTSMVNKTHLIDSLLSNQINVVKIFAPEHGFRGKADAGEIINNEKDNKTGLPIISVYGKSKKPQKEDLKDVDIMVFDLQDVGVRFYTYISHLHYIMEACAENNIELIILDRPNPHIHYVDGPTLRMTHQSFIGMHQVPLIYGMTIGEYGKMINGERWLENGVQCKLHIIPCSNYKRNMRYNLPIPPSPNLPNVNSVLLYPSICLFEGTTLSLGRGTSKQFQVIGHPAVNSNFSFTPEPNLGAKDPVLNGKLCFGEELSGLEPNDLFMSKKLDLSYIIKYYGLMSKVNEKYFLDNLFFDKLAGSDELRKQIIKGMKEEEIRSTWKEDIENFKIKREKYIIYEN